MFLHDVIVFLAGVAACGVLWAFFGAKAKAEAKLAEIDVLKINQRIKEAAEKGASKL